MANDEHSCCLHWDIHNPFIPWLDPWPPSKVLFYDGTPEPIRWKATIQPTGRRVFLWEFFFALECDHYFHEELEARDVWIRILLNDQLIEEKTGSNFTFYPDMREFSFYFKTEAIAEPSLEPNVLTVLIRLTLPEQDRRNIFHARDHETDTRRLSRDLRVLVSNPVHSNMRLKSRDDETCQVHSYIIRARWNSFFQSHRFDPAEQNPLHEIDVDGDILSDILLNYLYSGELETNWPYWDDIYCVKQVLSLIYNYDIYHLYNVLANNDVEQKLVTKKEVLTISFSARRGTLLSLDYLGGILRTDIDKNGYKFSFIFRVQNENGPRLSYSLRSEVDCRLFVQVNLAVIKKVDGHTFQQVRLLHEEDHTLESLAEIIGGKIVPLDNPQIFGDLYRIDRHGQRRQNFRYYIRAILKCTDGTENFQITSISNNRQNSLKRYSVLCDHMQSLMTNAPRLGDLYVAPRDRDWIHKTYKAIFAVRVPEWATVFENIEVEETRFVRLPLSDSAIPYVLSYICTARTEMIPRSFLDEIRGFAERGGCETLIDYVHRTRHQWAIAYGHAD